MSGLLLWAGIALFVLGVLSGYPQIAPYAETLVYSVGIPTAPPLPATLVPGGASRTLLQVFSGTGVRGRAASELGVSGDLTVTESSTPAAATPQSGIATVSPEPPFSPSETPVPEGTIPVALSIPAIDLQAPVVPIGWRTETFDGIEGAIWAVPDRRVVGWHRSSALLGVPGNTVLNGHNTSNGEVFRDLYRVEVGDQIFVQGADGHIYVYRVRGKYILKEAGQPLSVRLENARYIQETSDERLTLVTCHPYGSVANRLIVIAFPVGEGDSVRKGAS